MKIKQYTGHSFFLYTAFALSLALSFTPTWADSQFYFVRHAEFVKQDPAKPLSEEGMLRAKVLADYFEGNNITHVFATHTHRTRDTVMPLAKRHNLEIKQFPQIGTEVNGSKVTNLSKGKVAIKPMIAALKKIADGSKVLVSANSGNIFAIMAGLGVRLGPAYACGVTDESCLPCKDKSCFPTKEFHNIWHVIVTDKDVQMTRDKYGAMPVKTTESEVSEAFQRGWQHYRKETPDGFRKAASYFEHVIRLDPDYARAHSALAAVYWNSAWRSWSEPFGLSNSEMLVLSKKLLKRAMQSPSALTHQIASEQAAYFRRNPKPAFTEAEVAITMDANNPAGYLAKANAQLKAKKPGEAIATMKQAMQIDSRHPGSYLTRLGRAQFDHGEYAQAVATLESATELNSWDDRAYVYLAAAYGQLGLKADAFSAVDAANKLRSKNRWGNLTIEEINRWRWTGDRKRLKAGLISAGVESGNDWYARVTNSGNNIEIDGATGIGVKQAKLLYDAGVPFIDISTIGIAQASIKGAYHLRWGREIEMGPREFNPVRLKEIVTKSGGMVVFHPNGDVKRWCALSAAYAADLGFENVYYLRDSIDDWKKAGYPIESSR